MRKVSIPLFGALALLISGSAVPAPPGSSGWGREHHKLCVAVEIAEPLKWTTPDETNRLATSTLLTRLQMLMMQHGVNRRTPGETPKVEILSGLNGLSPGCSSTQSYIAVVKYKPVHETEAISAELSMTLAGKAILRNRHRFDPRITPNPDYLRGSQAAIFDDLDKLANSIFQEIDWERD